MEIYFNFRISIGLFVVLNIQLINSSTNNTPDINVTNFHPTLVTSNDNSSLTSEEDGSDEVPTIDVDVMPLEEICLLFGIPEEVCSCSEFPDFCPSKEVIIRFTCSTTSDKIEAIVACVIAIVGVFGNSLVLLVIIKQKKELGNFKKLIGLLALSDLIFSIFQIIVEIPKFWTCKWLYREAMCKVFVSSFNLNGMVSVGLIVTIALERYWGILKPLQRNFLKRHIWILLVVNILFSFIFNIPLFITLKVDQFGVCREDWTTLSVMKGSLIYAWALLILVFLLPVTVTFYLYYKIIQSLNKRVQGDVLHDMVQRENRLKANKRIMALFISLLAAFTILVLPNRIAWVILEMIGAETISKTSYRAIKYIGLFPYLCHVSVNPFIYSIIDKDFRREVNKLFCCKQMHFIRQIFSSHQSYDASTEQSRNRAQTRITEL